MSIVFVFMLIRVCGTITLDFINLKEGLGVSFIDLWKQVGYTVDDSGIYRSTLFDSNFTEGCPYKIIFKIIEDLDAFTLKFNEPYIDNTLSGVIASQVDSVSYNSEKITDPVVIQARPEEDVIFKAFAENDEGNLYFAVYFPKNVTEVPKYYVKPFDQMGVPLGSIPGNESLFIQFTRIKIGAQYRDHCILEPTTIQQTSDETTRLIDTTTSPQQTTKEAFEDITQSINGSRNVFGFCSKSDQVCSYCYDKSVEGQPTISTAKPAWTVSTASIIACCLRCSQGAVCRSIFFIQNTNSCIGLTHLENSVDQPINAVHFASHDCMP